MTEPPAYAETNPPFPIPLCRLHRLRPLHEWPHDGLGRMFILAWQENGVWIGMQGQWSDMLKRFVANSAIHCTNVLAGTPTHFVDDRGM